MTQQLSCILCGNTRNIRMSCDFSGNPIRMDDPGCAHCHELFEKLTYSGSIEAIPAAYKADACGGFLLRDFSQIPIKPLK